MSSDALFEDIVRIKGTRGANAKKEIVKEIMQDVDKCEILKYALDPFITFGVGETTLKKIDVECSRVSDGEFTDDTFELLDNLASRKLAGNAAIEAIRKEYDNLSTESGFLLKKVLLKSLDAGVTAKTFNNIKKGFVPSFECMLAAKFEAGNVKSWPQIIEPKYDGVRVLANVRNDVVRYFSRTGKEFFNFTHLDTELVDLANAMKDIHQLKAKSESYWFDGEIVSGSFNKTVGEVHKKDVPATDAIFHVFSTFSHESFIDESDKFHNYTVIRGNLEALFSVVKTNKVKLIKKYMANSVEEIQTFYRAFRSAGEEGVIVKDPNARYVKRRNKAWMKIKAHETVDLPVIEVEAGSGKYEGMLGALVVEHNGVEVNVGSGFTDHDRKHLWEARESLYDKIIEVSYHEVTPDGSLRHPVFERLRDKELEEA